MQLASLYPWLRFLLSLSLVLILGLVVIALLQKQMIYFPSRASEARLLDRAPSLGFEPWRDSKGAIIGWKRGMDSNPESRLVVFHGNAGSALNRGYFVNLLPENYQLLIFEYPGYGARDGSPDEDTLKSAALEALDSISSPAGSPPVYLVGESLGTGVASWLAGQRPRLVSGLLLISPMTSLIEVGQRHYPFLPVRLLMTERYDSVAALEGYNGPVAVVVGGRDKVIPAELSQTLFDSYSGPKQLWRQEEAGHNSIHYAPSWWQPVIQFLTETR